MVSLIFAFSQFFGTKRKHTGLTNSEYAEELVRISVLEEKLLLWWKFHFAVQAAKSQSLNIFVNVCFYSVFDTKRKHTSPSNSEYAGELVRITLLEEKFDLWWKLQFAV